MAKLVDPVAVIPPEDFFPRRDWDAGDLACVICGEQAQRHHVFYAQHVMTTSPRHHWDTRNRVGLCQIHHWSHHARSQTLGLLYLPDSAFAFGAEIFGTRAHGYLRRRYAGEDARLDALEPIEAVA